MGVMEGESAVMAVHGAEIDKARREGREPSTESKASMESMRADYEHQLDARFAGARGYVDAIVAPEESRDQLAFTLRIAANYSGPHLGPFVLPSLDSSPAR
jgi:3-methylcrotonyl-CoA carboxylase beta subunit